MKYKSIQSKTGIYFVTSVIAKHKPIFLSDEIATIPLNSLNWFRKQNLVKLFAFSLMPNHLHIIIKLIGADPVEKIMGSFHKFTGRRIIKYFETIKDAKSISFFHDAAENKSDRKHLVWEDSTAKIIEAEHVLLKLMEYVHNNPLGKKWKLAKERSAYRYSSACFYDKGMDPIITVDDVRELLL